MQYPHPLNYSGKYPYETHALIYNSSSFRPRSEFTCFVGFSQQTAIISLNRNNGLVFIIDTLLVFCETWSEFFSYYHMTFSD